MESVKNAVGLGSKKEESGEEPVSGETGEGTTAKPFDAGNHAEQRETTQTQPEQPASSDTPAKDSSSGGFLKSINPFSKKQADEDTNSTPAAKAQSSTNTTSKPEVDDSNRAPNHLGVDVPEGQSLDFAAPQPPEKSSSEGKKRMAANEPNQTVANASAEGTDSGFGKPGQLNPDWQSRSASGPKVQQLRGSRASMSAPSGQRISNPAGTNPGRIPTAGGQTVGARASEDRRRKSMWGSTDEGKMPELDKQGSPDPVTQGNTVANTAPLTSNGEGSSKAAEEPKPDFNTFAWGEGGEGAATAEAAEEKKVEETNNVEKKEETTTETTNGNKSSTAEKAEEVKDKLKDALPTSSSGGAEPKKERRASRFDAFKSKLMGKS